MAEFVYKGRSESGELVKGKLFGSSADAVAGRLTSLGITPVEIRDAAKSSDLMATEIFKYFGARQPTSKDLILFCR